MGRIKTKTSEAVSTNWKNFGHRIVIVGPLEESIFMDYGQIAEQLGNFKKFAEAIGGIFTELPKFLNNLDSFVGGGRGSSELGETSSILGSSK
jgi:hypothetical protein